MDKNSKILSDITVFNKYAKYIPELQRRETWEELVNRTKQMHLDKFKNLQKYDEFEIMLNNMFEKFIKPKKILPSMRSLQFAGKPIERNESRMYNCSFLQINSPHDFSEVMYLLLGGTGVGYSVQKTFLKNLPLVRKRLGEIIYTVEDSIEGWSTAIEVLMYSYMYTGIKVKFDFSQIRDKGMPLITSGGKAPGHKPLKDCLKNMESILDKAAGKKLTSLQAHDILCYIADAVLAGGIRRAAMICLFDADDEEMLNCKSGDWYINHLHRSRANNSVILDRKTTTKEQFYSILKKTQESQAGEPGIFFTNNPFMGTNPCGEIALNDKQFCNLVEVNVSNLKDEKDFYNRVEAAAMLATIQASYTNFTHLSPEWKEITEKEALIGVSLTGLASVNIPAEVLNIAAEKVKKCNEYLSKILGINPAARTTCVKPAGTTSLVCGTSSGIHAWHSEYYVRRMRLPKTDPLYDYMLKVNPDFLENDVTDPMNTSILKIPIKAPKGAITRKESPLETLERIKHVYENWIVPGHSYGDNTNNVSATINIKDDEWDAVIDWMWENKHCYNGISLFPYDGGTYIQAPFEEISEEEFSTLSEKLNEVDLTQVKESEDFTQLIENLACSGGFCEIT